MKIDITPIIQSILALCAALITYKLIPWIKSKTTQQQQETIKTAVRVAVYAAEQIYGSNTGHEKFDYVVQAMERNGFTMDREKLQSYIEAAVGEMNATVLTPICTLEPVEAETAAEENES